MKKLISFFRREINKKVLLSIIPLVVVLFPLAMPVAYAANVDLFYSSIEKWPAASDVWPAEASPEYQNSNYDFTKWPASEEAWSNSFVTVRTIVLTPVNGREGACISANVVYDENEYMIAYQGVYYKITPLSGYQGYDSQVEIGGVKYMFHLKLHPYE